jgi:acetyl esterase
VVFFHGGGWVICSLDTHDNLARDICRAADAVVVSVDYRMAPEYRYPTAVHDSFAATKWVADNAASLNIDATRLALCGDSAGGNLSAWCRRWPATPEARQSPSLPSSTRRST